MGRKTKYDPNTFPLLAEGYAREGLSDAEISAKLGISKDRFYAYQNRYPDFFDAIKRGKAPVDIEVENALLRRAKGYEFEETTTEVRVDEQGNALPKVVKKTKKFIPPDVGAIAFWLKNRKPETWRDKHEIEGFVDGALEINVVHTDREEERHIKDKIPTAPEDVEKGGQDAVKGD